MWREHNYHVLHDRDPNPPDWDEEPEEEDEEYSRCPIHFEIMGIVFKCDLDKSHYGQHISFPDGDKKVATVSWPPGTGFQ